MKDSNTATSSYRNIMSSTAIFGGVQIINIGINVIRGKLVSMILHTTGMGILSVFSSAANVVQQFAQMGLNVSAVRTISQANDATDEQAIAFTTRLVRTMIVIASVAGMVLMALMSPLFSGLSFGDLSFTPYFILLGLLVFFNIMGAGETAILQGRRQYKQLAFCSTVPPLAGLLISIPIYYFWRINGIVPAMICVSLIYYVALRVYSYRDRRPRSSRERLTLRRIWITGQEMIKLGFVLTIGVLAGTITTYLVIAFISNIGVVEHVGLYQAAHTITGQYVGLVFTAMATDYYPHLSSLAKDNTGKAFELVNQQTEIVLLIMAPIAMLMILTAPVVVNVLLTEEFMPICLIMRFMGLACIIRALSAPMDYIAYANGDRKFILWIETLWGCAKTLVVMTLCYYFFGFIGLGYGALACAVIDLIVSIVATRWRYGFRLSGRVIQLMLPLLIIATCCFAGSLLTERLWRYVVMTPFAIIGCAYSLYQLNLRMDLRAQITNWRKRRSGRAAANEQ